MLVLVIFVSSFFTGVFSQEDHGLGKLEVESELIPDDCYAQAINFVLTDPTNALPMCTSKWIKDETCTTYHKSTYKSVISKPTCTLHGTFGPVQCKGERTTGRCFCFDEKGYRLFGQEWWSKAENMTCACSRRKAEMSDPTLDNYVFFNSMHCDSIGNYEPLQCDVISEQCWCTDPQTGELTSPIVPMVAVSKLACYNSLEVGTQYLRQCENKKFAQTNIEHQLSLRGSEGVTFADYQCDDDGSFGAYTLIDGLGYCTWRDNTKIGSWAAADPDPDTLTCHCARDTHIFTAAGKVQSLKCAPTGNYQLYQGSGEKMYCIDPDGYIKSPVGINAEQDSDCENYISYVEMH